MADLAFLGVDLLLDDAGELALGPDGDLVEADPVTTVVQDVISRLSTRRGGLWYRPDFGSILPELISAEVTTPTLLAIEQALREELRGEPRLVHDQTAVEVQQLDRERLAIRLTLRVVGSAVATSLVLVTAGVELVVADFGLEEER